MTKIYRTNIGIAKSDPGCALVVLSHLKLLSWSASDEQWHWHLTAVN
jgi:hypothetical protein